MGTCDAIDVWLFRHGEIPSDEGGPHSREFFTDPRAVILHRAR